MSQVNNYARASLAWNRSLELFRFYFGDSADSRLCALGIIEVDEADFNLDRFQAQRTLRGKGGLFVK